MSDRLQICSHPTAKLKLTTLRDISTPPEQFCKALHELSVILMAETTRRLERVLNIVERPVQTPLAEAPGYYLEQRIVLVPVLRAGLGMLDAGTMFFPGARVCELGLKRDEHTFQISCYMEEKPAEPPDLAVILDPMVATGGSGIEAIHRVKGWRTRRIVYVAVLAAPFGISQIHTFHDDVPIFLAALDDGLDNKNYIIPGLGDAGDRLCGT